MITARLVKLKPWRPEKISTVADSTYCAAKLAEQAGISHGTLDNARVVLNHGAPNIVAMVEKGEVSVRTAREAVTEEPSKELQANWTKDDVQRVGRKRMNSYASSKNRKSISKKYERPPSIKFPTAEETGFPVNGTLEEKFEHHRKYGRTPLHAKEVKDMLNNNGSVEGYITALIAVTSDSHPAPEAFFTAIEALLSWVPRPEKGPDWAINFAAKARKHLALLETRLPLAVERLTKLQEAWKQRNLHERGT